MTKQIGSSINKRIFMNFPPFIQQPRVLISVRVGVYAKRSPLAIMPANEKRHDMPRKKWIRELKMEIVMHVARQNIEKLGFHFESSHAVKMIVINSMLFQNPHLKKMRYKAAILTGQPFNMSILLAIAANLTVSYFVLTWSKPMIQQQEYGSGLAYAKIPKQTVSTRQPSVNEIIKKMQLQ